MSEHIFRPVLYAASSPTERGAVTRLRANRPDLVVVDTLKEQLRELAEIRDPSAAPHSRDHITVSETDGVWVYYPWRNTLVRVLAEADYHQLRTSRNQLLITPTEQVAFGALRVAVAGLNVGNPAALCMALEGGANRMRFADFDELSVSNLNRFRAGLPDIGLNKAVLSARQVYEVNPYAHIDVWERGLAPGREPEFLEGIDLLIEEMDNLALKLSVRAAAKAKGIPVVMVTGNGPNVVLDIERYDLGGDISPLNGQIPERIIAAAAKPLPSSVQDRAGLARDFMGPGVLTDRLLESFKEVGQTLAGIPQLAESSFLRGAAACFAVRAIATGAVAESGRYHIKLDEVLT